MARTLDPDVDSAIDEAVLTLLREVGFAGLTIASVASRADIGKPAIYRRYEDKATMVAAVIARSQLRPLEIAEAGDTRAELLAAMADGFPPDAPGYVRLIGALIAEEVRHPEVMAAYRESVLGPRRARVMAVIERGRQRGDIRRDIDPVDAVDRLAGPLLARVFAGEDTGEAWRRRNFDAWWKTVEARSGRT